MVMAIIYGRADSEKRFLNIYMKLNKNPNPFFYGYYTITQIKLMVNDQYYNIHILHNE